MSWGVPAGPEKNMDGKDLTLAFEIGGTNLRYGVTDENFRVLDFDREPTKRLSDAEDKGSYLAGLTEKLIRKYGHDRFRCAAVSLASLMNRERTVNYSSPNIRGFDNISLTRILEDRLQMPAYMERDVNTELLFEIRNAGIDPKGIVVGIFLGTGLGNAMAIDGKIYIGSSGSSCELGHIPVLGFSKPCGCGKNGCIELKASGRTLAELAEKLDCPVEKIFVRFGDNEAVRDVVHAAAVAAATEITILDPAYVFLGGGVIDMEGFPLDTFEDTVRENLRIPCPRQTVRFLRASGKPEAGMVGAAIHASGLYHS